MNSNSPSSSCLSLQWLLDELEDLIAAESKKQANPWFSKDRLTELFYQQHGIIPEDIANQYGMSLKSALINRSRRFSVYNATNPQLFYVALFDSLFPPKSDIPLKDSLQRDDVDTKPDIPIKDSPQGDDVDKNSWESLPEYRLNLPEEIISIDDFETYLIEIVVFLTQNNYNNFVCISELSQAFCNCYGQPIRSVVRTICPDMKLIELLQVIPTLDVGNIEDTWQITIRNSLDDKISA